MTTSDDGYRLDSLSGDWIAVVPGRRKAYRPRRPRPAELPKIEGRCPFCPGHEADTEQTIARFPEHGPWSVRVVANIFPLAEPGAEIAMPDGGEARAARGAHEVVIEHPDHDVDRPDYDDAHLLAVLQMYRDRVGALSALEGSASVIAFRNRGRRAGSSQPHPHGQIVAGPVAPPRITRRHTIARAHYRATGGTILAAQVAEEQRAGARIIEERRGFVAYVPFAPRQNHHVRIAAATSTGGFGGIGDDTASALASILGRVLWRVRSATSGAPYNLLFESPPVGAEGDPAAFWFVDVLPRRGGHAGFELGSGIEVVTVLPERAAEERRAAPF